MNIAITMPGLEICTSLQPMYVTQCVTLILIKCVGFQSEYYVIKNTAKIKDGFALTGNINRSLLLICKAGLY